MVVYMKIIQLVITKMIVYTTVIFPMIFESTNHHHCINAAMIIKSMIVNPCFRIQINMWFLRFMQHLINFIGNLQTQWPKMLCWFQKWCENILCYSSADCWQETTGSWVWTLERKLKNFSVSIIVILGAKFPLFAPLKVIRP